MFIKTAVQITFPRIREKKQVHDVFFFASAAVLSFSFASQLYLSLWVVFRVCACVFEPSYNTVHKHWRNVVLQGQPEIKPHLTTFLIEHVDFKSCSMNTVIWEKHIMQLVLELNWKLERLLDEVSSLFLRIPLSSSVDNFLAHAINICSQIHILFSSMAQWTVPKKRTVRAVVVLEWSQIIVPAGRHSLAAWD